MTSGVLTSLARRIGIGLVTASVGLALLATATRAEDDAASPIGPVMKSLETDVRNLARSGYAEAVAELLDILGALGRTDAELAKPRSGAERLLERAKPSNGPRPREAKRMKKAAARLAGHLAEASSPQARKALAGVILRLDGDQEAARVALGHKRIEGGWVPAEVVPLLERRREIQIALQRARRLEVPIATGKSPVAFIRELDGRDGVFVRWSNVEVHSGTVSAVKLERILREALRATAFSQYLRHGELALPKASPNPYRWVQPGSREGYMRAVDLSESSGNLSAKEAGYARRLAGYDDQRGFRVVDTNVEATLEAAIFWDLWFQLVWADTGTPQPCLGAGHMSWVCLSYLGTALPTIAWREMLEAGGSTGRTRDTPEVTRERRELLRLANGGISGTRAYLRFLAARGEDPAWSASMLDEIGKITGDDLLKSTVVVDYLHEHGSFQDLLKKTANKPVGPPTFAEALGTPLADFEARWKRWILPLRGGLAQRLAGAPARAEPSPDDKALLRHLDGIRKATLSKEDFAPLALSDELSVGCRNHALYLARHPHQAAAWPDAHEEYPDQEGFSPRGSRAGLASVIAPGTEGPVDAVDAWMGTFYHRLPLLDPGLIRVGWGFEKNNAVLDVSSFVAPVVGGTTVVWPPGGMTGVPRHFRPELPNPVPGADQAAWGYPITLQLFVLNVGEDPLQMTLRKKGGAAVDCHYSTPQRPTNPDLAPAGAYCLIPKQALQPGTEYEVSATGIRGKDTYSWSFRTGR